MSLENALAKFARADVKRVTREKSRELLITGTKKGLVALRFFPADTFTVTTQGFHAEELFRGPLVEVVPFLMTIYEVEGR
jgi:hypothetical protein